MMLVKHHVGNGSWHIHEAVSGVEFVGPHVTREVVTRADDPKGPPLVHRYQLSAANGEDFWAVYIDEIPRHDLEAEVVLLSLHGDPPTTFVRWASWVNVDGDRELLVTDAPIFICNERGDTIESLR